MLLTVVTTSTFVSAQIIDGPIAREQLSRTVRKMLYQEKFDDLEKMAAEFRTTNATFPEGVWKLKFYYDAFDSPIDKTPEGWNRFLIKFDKWQKVYPQSVTVRTAAGTAWMGYGWEAREGGNANTVSEEGWKLLAERLKKALPLLSTRPGRKEDDCPERYNKLLVLGKALSWDRNKYEALFREAVAFRPDYLQFYFNKSDYLLPKWHGVDGEWQQFALDAVKLTPKKYGYTAYTRILWGAWEGNDLKSFDQQGVSWPLMKQGFQDIEAMYGNSPWNLNNFCKFACFAGDKETALNLFKKIADRPYIKAWKSVDEYAKWSRWAGYDKAGETKTGNPSFPNGTEDFHQMLALARAGDVEAQYNIGTYYNWGELTLKNYAEAEKWFQKAAGQGHAEAQVSLAILYNNDRDPIKGNLKEAMKLNFLAAMQGDDNGANSLGNMYQMGWGVKKDLAKAYVWFSQIRRWKDDRVAHISGKLTLEKRKLAEEEAEKLRAEISANREAAELGVVYQPDEKKLKQLFRTFNPVTFADLLEPANEGDPDAQFKLGRKYDTGDGAIKDPVAAEIWIRKAAVQGHPGAQSQLAIRYSNGDPPLKKDLKESKKWHYLAAMQGNENSADALGLVYFYGIGVPKNPIKAFAWYSQDHRWQDPNLKQISAKLPPEQLSQAKAEADKLANQIKLNKEAAEGGIAFKPDEQTLRQLLETEAPYQPVNRPPSPNIHQGTPKNETSLPERRRTVVPSPTIITPGDYEIKRDFSLSDIEFIDFDVYWSKDRRGNKYPKVTFRIKNVSPYAIGHINSRTVISLNNVVISEFGSPTVSLLRSQETTYLYKSSDMAFDYANKEWSKDKTMDVKFYVKYNNTELLAKTVQLPPDKIYDNP
jgi:TPR repeat protein